MEKQVRIKNIPAAYQIFAVAGKNLLSVSKNEHADNYRHNKKIKLPAVICFKSQKSLNNIDRLHDR